MKKQLLASTLCLVSFLGCQKEEVQEKADLNQSNITITTISNEFIENDKQLSSILERFNSNTNDSASRLVYNNQYSFVIDTESAILIEDGDYHSYTFALYGEDTSVTQNLLLSYNTTNDSYTAYKTTYDLTYEERLNTINGIYENQISENLVHTELLDIDTTGILNRTGGLYYLGDGLCGTFDHVTVDPENPERIILHFVNVHSCESNDNNNPVIFDVPDSGGGFNFISINFYNSTTGATEEWDANDWSAVNGGSFSSGNGQVTYFPTTNTIPIATKRQHVLNTLNITSFGPNAEPEKFLWVLDNENSFEVSEVYDYIEDDTDKFGTDQEALDFADEAINEAEEGSELDMVNEIIKDSSFVNTKTDCVYELLKSTGNNLFKDLMSDFTNNKSKSKLKFQIGEVPDAADGLTTYDSDSGIITITFPPAINTLTSLEVAALILHEGLHAELRRIYEGNNQVLEPLPQAQFDYLVSYWEYYKGIVTANQVSNYASHTYMVYNHLEPLAAAIRELDDNHYDLNHYMWYAWDGLSDIGRNAIPQLLNNAQENNYQNLQQITINDEKQQNCDE